MRPLGYTETKVAVRVVLLAAGLAIGLVLAEAGLRIYARVNESFAHEIRSLDVFSARVEPHGTIGFRQKPSSTFRYWNGRTATTNAMGFRGPLVLIPKPSKTFRIVLLGGSTTHGWYVNDNETIDAYMRELLSQRYPASQFEVVNLAFDGYDSYQLVERLRTDGLPLDPDLIIVNSGINDVRNAKFPNLQDPDPRTLLWRGVLDAQRDQQRLGRHTLFTRLKHVSYLARLPGFFRQSIAMAQSGKKQEKISPNPTAVTYFGGNMWRIVEIVRHRAVPILFSSPPSMLTGKFAQRRRPPSYWLEDASATEAYRLALANRMRSVVAELARGRYPARYVSHNLPLTMFRDDCHLTPEGNRRMAKDFVDAAEPYIIAHLNQSSPAIATSQSKR